MWHIIGHSTWICQRIQGCLYIYFYQMEILASYFFNHVWTQQIPPWHHVAQLYTNLAEVCLQRERNRSSSRNKRLLFVLPGNGCKMIPCQYGSYGLRSVLLSRHRAINQGTVGSSLSLAFSRYSELWSFGVRLVRSVAICSNVEVKGPMYKI